MSESWLRLHHGQREERNDLHRSHQRSDQTAHEHREGLLAGFTKEHGCSLLVWFERYDDLQEARQRELQMKDWKRAWKIRLIEEANLDWIDLYPSLVERADARPGPRPSPGNEVA